MTPRLYRLLQEALPYLAGPIVEEIREELAREQPPDPHPHCAECGLDRVRDCPGCPLRRE